MFKSCLFNGCLGIALALTMSSGQVVHADEGESVEVSFALEFSPSLLPDDDGDGSPDLPNLMDDQFKLFIFGGPLDAAASIQFSGSSPNCGDREIAGKQFWLHSVAKIVHRGRPYNVTVFQMSIERPDYHSVLFTDDILSTDACWVKEDSFGKLIVQSDFGPATLGCFVFVNAVVPTN